MKVAKVPRKFKRAYETGGTITSADPTQKAAISSANMESLIGAGASLVGSLADTFDRGNSRGHQSGLTTGLKQGASMAATGAAIGSVIPGIGTLAGGAVGSAIGLASGLIGSAGQGAQDRALDRYDAYQEQNYQVAQGNARVAADPSLVYGQRGAQMFAQGGQLPNQRRPIQLKQVNVRAPIVTHNPKDPKLKSYNDSLFLYNEMNAYRDKIIKSGLYKPKTNVYPVNPEDKITPKRDRTLTFGDASSPKLFVTNTWKSLTASMNSDVPKITLHEKKGIAPVNDEFFTRKETVPTATPTGGKGAWYGDSIENYKKPTQPVIYQPLQPKPKPKPRVQPKAAPVQEPPINTFGRDTTKPLSSSNPVTVEKADGSIGIWGKDIDTVATKPLPKRQPVVSDKAKGASSNYYPAYGQQRGPDVPVQKPSRPYYAAGGMMKAYGGNTLTDNVMKQTYADGGSLDPMSSNSVEVKGQSHEQGGVQLPQAEVEGGETIANGFVFSKSLGFADLHKPIAKAMGKIEAKPMNPVRRKTMNILEGREQGLMLSQEFLKQRLGIPSDLNT